MCPQHSENPAIGKWAKWGKCASVACVEPTPAARADGAKIGEKWSKGQGEQVGRWGLQTIVEGESK